MKIRSKSKYINCYTASPSRRRGGGKVNERRMNKMNRTDGVILLPRKMANSRIRMSKFVIKN